MANHTNVILKSLEEVLEYQNENVIDRFINSFTVQKEEAHEIFNETKKWLWLSAKSFEDNEKNIFIGNDLLIIDEMWHIFLLFSLDYYAFYEKNFNVVVHHIPIVKDENNSITTTLSDYKDREDAFYNYVFNNLGETTFNKWFLEYPKKYSKENIKSIYKGLY